jgi:cell wall assembly regulator SMI1
MTILEPNEPAGLKAIVDLEQELGVTLPDDYRNFLMQHNGGYPEPDGFRYYSRYPGNYFGDSVNVERAMVDRFLALYDGEYNNLQNYREMYQGRVPSEMLPIANDPGGNLICLAIRGNNLGKVLYWKHEEEADEGEVANYSNIYFVADSFVQFVDSLTT